MVSGAARPASALVEVRKLTIPDEGRGRGGGRDGPWPECPRAQRVNRPAHPGGRRRRRACRRAGVRGTVAGGRARGRPRRRARDDQGQCPDEGNGLSLARVRPLAPRRAVHRAVQPHRPSGRIGAVRRGWRSACRSSAPGSTSRASSAPCARSRPPIRPPGRIRGSARRSRPSAPSPSRAASHPRSVRRESGRPTSTSARPTA